MKKAMAFTPGLFPAPTAENLAKYTKPKLWKKFNNIYELHFGNGCYLDEKENFCFVKHLLKINHAKLQKILWK